MGNYRYAIDRHAQYELEEEAAQQLYRDTRDLGKFQEAAKAARESWEADIRDSYRDLELEAQVRELLARHGRVYATLEDGQVVRLHNIGNLYRVSSTVGGEVPIIARGPKPYGSDTTIADYISKA